MRCGGREEATPCTWFNDNDGCDCVSMRWGCWVLGAGCWGFTAEGAEGAEKEERGMVLGILASPPLSSTGQAPALSHDGLTGVGKMRIASTTGYMSFLMPVVTSTTKHENGDGLVTPTGLIAGVGGWIPAFAGMTMGWWHDGYFQGNDMSRMALYCLRYGS